MMVHILGSNQGLGLGIFCNIQNGDIPERVDIATENGPLMDE
jgi:hypothetical protein